jgi:hypothetical protein
MQYINNYDDDNDGTDMNIRRHYVTFFMLLILFI